MSEIEINLLQSVVQSDECVIDIDDNDLLIPRIQSIQSIQPVLQIPRIPSIQSIQSIQLTNQIKVVQGLAGNPMISHLIFAHNPMHDNLCMGLPAMIQRTIQVIKATPNIDNYQYIKVPTRTVIKRVVFLLFVFCISIPYPVWIGMVPDLITSEGGTNYLNSSVIFKSFMTVVNSVPLLSFLTYVLIVIKHSNNALEQKLKIFRSCIVTHDYNFSKRELVILRGIVDDIGSLNGTNRLQSNSLAEQIISRQYAKWRQYMITASVWTIVSCVLYGLWTGRYILGVTCNAQYSGTCSIFIILYMTSFVRFFVPLFIIFSFSYECDVMLNGIKLWYSAHYSSGLQSNGLQNHTIDVPIVCSLLKTNIDRIKERAMAWQWVMLVTFILPIIGMLLLFISSLFDKSIINIIDNEWVAWIYCVHYSLIGMYALFKASTVSLGNYRMELLSDRLIQCIKFNDDPMITEEYDQYIGGCYQGFRVFGIPMTTSTLSSCIVILLGVISWLLDYIV
jgi:hypothetical protein